MKNFTAMFQYDETKFSVIHGKGDVPSVNDKANVNWMCSLISSSEVKTNSLIIEEIISTRPHKTDERSEITIVKLRNGNESK